MKILNRYIAREIIKATALAALVLLTLVNIFTLSDELRDVGKGSYELKQVFTYVALTSPRNLFELIPSSALVGSMFALGAMANHSELVVMRTSGVSMFKLIWAVLRAGLIIVISSTLLGEFIAPAAERSAQLLKNTSQKNQIASWSQHGFWIRDGQSFINIRNIPQQNEIGDIQIFELDTDRQLRFATRARQATYSEGEWQLKDIHQSEFKSQQIITHYSPSAAWSSILDPDLLSIVIVDPAHLSTTELSRFIGFMKQNGQKSDLFELAFWNRIMNPFATLVMLLLAIPFILGHARFVHMGQRVIMGVILGLIFYLFDKMFGNIGLVYKLNPVFAATFPGIVFFIAASIAIKRLR